LDEKLFKEISILDTEFNVKEYIFSGPELFTSLEDVLLNE
jgi:hypothetical protein